MANFKTTIQGTSVTTGVTQNATHGRIQSFAATTAAAGSFEFTLTNKNIREGAQLFPSLLYAGTTGIPVIRVKSYGTGSCVIVVSNVHPSGALNAAVSFDYLIFQN